MRTYKEIVKNYILINYKYNIIFMEFAQNASA